MHMVCNNVGVYNCYSLGLGTGIVVIGDNKKYQVSHDEEFDVPFHSITLI